MREQAERGKRTGARARRRRRQQSARTGRSHLCAAAAAAPPAASAAREQRCARAQRPKWVQQRTTTAAACKPHDRRGDSGSMEDRVIFSTSAPAARGTGAGHLYVFAGRQHPQPPKDERRHGLCRRLCDMSSAYPDGTTIVKQGCNCAGAALIRAVWTIFNSRRFPLRRWIHGTLSSGIGASRTHAFAVWAGTVRMSSWCGACPVRRLRQHRAVGAEAERDAHLFARVVSGEYGRFRHGTATDRWYRH